MTNLSLYLPLLINGIFKINVVMLRNPSRIRQGSSTWWLVHNLYIISLSKTSSSKLHANQPQMN